MKTKLTDIFDQKRIVMIDNLLPCPFCGSFKLRLDIGSWDFRIACKKCRGASGRCNDQKEAETAWIKRNYSWENIPRGLKDHEIRQLVTVIRDAIIPITSELRLRDVVRKVVLPFLEKNNLRYDAQQPIEVLNPFKTQPTIELKDLLPCTFCGSTRIRPHRDQAYHLLRCHECLAELQATSGWTPDPNDSRIAWNRRSYLWNEVPRGLQHDEIEHIANAVHEVTISTCSEQCLEDIVKIAITEFLHSNSLLFLKSDHKEF